jgi:EpsI family protein
MSLLRKNLLILTRMMSASVLAMVLRPTTHKIAGPPSVPRVDTQPDERREPVTCWSTIGNQVVHGGVHKKLVEISYGLPGRIPDGLLFRVSSFNPEVAHAYDAQASFINQLLSAVTPAQRQRLAGIPES